MDFRYIVGFISEWLGAIAVAWLFSLSPRFNKPPIGFKYARREGFIALSLFGLILILAYIFYSLRPPIFPANLRPFPAPVVDLKEAILVAGASLLAFIAALFTRKQPLRSTGWNPALFGPALQVGFGIAVLTIFLRNRVMDIFTHMNSQQLFLLLLAIGVALAEETIFRGYIQLRLVWWLGEWPGLALTALTFTLWHTPAWLNRLPLQTGLIIAGLTFAQGLVLGWIMQKSKHVIAPAFYRAFSIWMNFFA